MIIILIHVLRLLGICMCINGEKATPPPPLIVHSLPAPSSALPPPCSPSFAPTPPVRSIAPPSPSIASPTRTIAPPLPSSVLPPPSSAPSPPCSPLIAPTPPMRTIAPPPPSSALPPPCSPLTAPTPSTRSIAPPPPYSPLIGPTPQTRSIAPPSPSSASPSPSSAPPPPSIAPLPRSIAPPQPCSPLIAPAPPTRLVAPPSPSSASPPPPSAPPPPSSATPPPLCATPPPCSPSIAPTPPVPSIAPPTPSITPPARSIAPPPRSCSQLIAPTPPTRSVAPPSPSSTSPPLPSTPPPPSSATPPPCSPSIAPTPPVPSIAPPTPSITPPPRSIEPPVPSIAPPPPRSIVPPAPSIAPLSQSITSPARSIGPPTSSIAPPPRSITPSVPSIAPPVPSNAPLAPSIALPPLLPPLIAPSPTAPPSVLSPPFPSSVKHLQTLIPPHTSDVWRALDVRAMVLLSLLSQIALFVLGKRRKHSVSRVNKLILWLAYQGKDLISIAALGKLSNLGGSIDALGKLSNRKEEWVNMIALDTQSNTPTGFAPKPSNIFTSLWAPLLTLNLGGPDTMTASSFEDIKLWSRHLLTLVFQCFLAFCVILWSVVHSFLSVFSIPLFFVGTCKHIESILCLKAANCLKTKQFVFKNPGRQSHPLIENQESKKVLLGYILFAAMIPDDNNYLCYMEYPLCFKGRMRTYLETRNEDRLILQALLESDEPRSGNHLTHFDIAVVELGFIYDVFYTKAPLIYTWKGCILRLISLTLSIGTLFFFIFNISFGHLSLRLNKIAAPDVFLTMSLLVKTIALDISAVLSNLYSDWAVVLMYDNCSALKIPRYVLQYFPCFSRRKKRSASMGQFDLLDYCWNSRRVGVYRFLQKHCGGDILENCLRSKHTKSVEVPSCLRPKDVYQSRLDSFVSGDSFKATRGEKTLDELGERDLEYSIKIHFEASIIVWHLATSICYHQDFENLNNASNEAMKISKYLSDYMMYLLVMQPAMLLPDHWTSFSLDCALEKLTVLISKASNKRDAVHSLLQDPREIRSAETGMENLPKYVGYLATKLNRNIDKWKLIKAMWIEMLLYAAHSNPYINHVTQLAEYGREFISIIWVMGSYRVIQEAIEEACRKE